MGDLMTIATKAIIYIPPDVPDSDLHTKQTLMHLERRGYDLACMPLSDWDEVINVLKAKLATVVVFARPEHYAGCEPRVEFVGEETQRLCRMPKDGNDRRWLFGKGGSRSRRPRPIN